MADWFREASDGAILSVHVQPGARKSGIPGVLGGALRIRLTAPASEGRANAALVAFLAERLGLPRSAIELKSGLASRHKQVLVRGAGADTLRRLLAESAAG